MRYCATCNYALTLGVDASANCLVQRCRRCATAVPVDATTPLGVVSETTFRTAAGALAAAGGTASALAAALPCSGNEGAAGFTAWDDPALPITLDVDCPACAQLRDAGAAPAGVVFRKTNARELRFEYRCRACRLTWQSGV